MTDMDRRNRSLFANHTFTLATLVLLGLVTLGSPAAAQVPPPDAPNIVLILADDVGYGDIGAYGATDISTPSIDRLANEGVKLDDFYTAPSCSLSRNMLVTGSYAPRLSSSRNYTPSSSFGIHENEVTIGEVLQGAGYVTGIFGKWHLGDHYQFRPQRHGFDEFYGVPYSNDMWPFHPRIAPSANEDPRLTAARDRAEQTGYAGQGSFFPQGEGFPNLPLYDGDTIVEFNSQQEEFGAAFFDRAIDFIERHSNQRFFAYIPLTAAHVPLHPGPAFEGTSSRDLYGDTILEVDDGVGRILDKLVELGIDNDTLVIFLSDNGPWLAYGIDGGSADPFSGGKETQFEGGIRVPALMRWPGGLGPRPALDEPLGLIDMLPTLATLAGATLPTNRTIDGVDAWPVLSGQAGTVSRPAIFGFDEDNFTEVELGAIRSGNWKLHVNTSGRNVSATALYDLTNDLAETNDRRSSQPGVVASLIALGEQIVGDILDNQRPLGTVSLNGDPFAQKRGAGDMVVMEAEHFHVQLARGGQSWQTVSPRHSSAEESLQALPNVGNNVQADYENQSPQLGYRVIFEKTGRYYVWIRARGASNSDDSLHIGLNGQAVPSGERVEGIADFWGWTSTLDGGGRVFVDVTAIGEHVIDVWMREDGVVIDKLLLTTDVAFTPKAKGLVESRQSTDGLVMEVVANDDGPYDVDEGGSILGAFNVLDNDTNPGPGSLSAILVDAPANSALFELRPDGTFDYTHDGGETTTDSFTYRADNGTMQSDVATVSLTINPVNDPPELTLLGSNPVTLVAGNPYIDAGATAQDAEDGDISANIVVGGDTVDTGSVGSYVITYDVTDSGGAAAPQITRTVNVTAGNAPVITLLGSNPVNLAVGDSYTDAGATATDIEDGNITANIVVGGDTVDTDTAGTYVITYDVTDSAGNAAVQVTRTVNVADTDQAPVISLNGLSTVVVTFGSRYVENGASAIDPQDGDLTDSIVIGGDRIVTTVPGDYTVTYDVTDSDGNAAAQVTRRVVVGSRPSELSGGGQVGPVELAIMLVLALLAAGGRRHQARRRTARQ